MNLPTLNAASFTKALAFTLREEGGLANVVGDHGGRTMHGVTQAEYDRWRTRHGLQPIDVADISDEEVRQVYAEDYWQAGHCDDMSLPLAIVHFDWCVNHGPDGAIRNLQRTLMIADDGIFGPKTRAALADQDHDGLWREYDRERRDWYQADIKNHPDQGKFGRDWLGRVDRLDAYVEAL